MDATAVRLLDPLTISDEDLAASRRANRVARSVAGLAVDSASESPIGRVNTSAHVARWMAAEALSALAENTDRDVRNSTILEPAAGSGVIVAALAEQLGTLDPISAIDADAAMRELTLRRLRCLDGRISGGFLHYRVGDALLDDHLLPPRPIDLIIGNPPYLGVRHARRLPQFERWRGRFGASEDLYAYFMRRAMHIVRPGGFVMLLVPDTWLTLSSYERLRRELLAGRLKFVLRLPPDTFDRHVFTCAFLWQRAEPTAHRVRYLDARAPYSLDRLRELTIRQSAYDSSPSSIIFQPTAHARKMARALARAVGCVPPTYVLSGQPVLPSRASAGLLDFATHFSAWCNVASRASSRASAGFFSTADVRDTLDAYPSTPRPPSPRIVPLGEVAHIGDVGIHSRNCRHRLFFATRERPGLQRLLQGRQIEPYAVRWDSPKARYRWVDIHYRPDARVPGRRGDGSPSVRGEYWSWQGDPAIFRLPERILIRQTGDRIVAARLTQTRTHHYTDNTLFTAVLTDAARTAGITLCYLLGYLNSEIVSELYRFLSGEAGRPQAQVKVGLLRRLPFVLPSPPEIRRGDGWVRRIERRAAHEITTRWLQAAVDRHFAGQIENPPSLRLLSDTPRCRKRRVR